MITYSVNWMGPINPDWIKKNGDYWAAGRIDIRGIPDDPYGDEYGLSAMHMEDWCKLRDWLVTYKTEEVVSYETLIESYEKDNPKIRWFKDKSEKD